MMNPELRRNLWLEITTHRLLAMPVVLGLSFLVLGSLDKANSIEHVSWLALVAFGLLTVLWGSRLAANSIIDEMVDKTWDWQRLSTLGPWTMTWGKLLGSTVFAWYGGLICLVVFLATSSSTKIVAPFKLGLSFALFALLLHAATMAAALHTSRNGEPASRRSIGIVVVFLLLYIVPVALTKAWDTKETVAWYATRFEAVNFTLASAAVFAAWAVTGAYRCMCQGLAVRTTPWVWVTFLVFVTIYSAGFAITGTQSDKLAIVAISFAGVLAGLLATYVMLFTEPTGPVVLRRVAQKIKLKQWTRAWQEVPCWSLAWLFAALCTLAFVLDSAINSRPAWQEWLTPVPALFLVARDAGIFLFFSAAPQPKRVVGTTLVYMLLLYWIVPGILDTIGLTQLSQWVRPIGPGSAWTQIASALVQALVAGGLAYRRIQVNFSNYRRADGA